MNDAVSRLSTRRARRRASDSRSSARRSGLRRHRRIWNGSMTAARRDRLCAARRTLSPGKAHAHRHPGRIRTAATPSPVSVADYSRCSTSADEGVRVDPEPTARVRRACARRARPETQAFGLAVPSRIVTTPRSRAHSLRRDRLDHAHHGLSSTGPLRRPRHAAASRQGDHDKTPSSWGSIRRRHFGIVTSSSSMLPLGPQILAGPVIGDGALGTCCSSLSLWVRGAGS